MAYNVLPLQLKVRVLEILRGSIEVEKMFPVAAPCLPGSSACFFGAQAGGDEAAPAVAEHAAAVEKGYRPSFCGTDFVAAAARLCVWDTMSNCRRLLLTTECAWAA